MTAAEGSDALRWRDATRWDRVVFTAATPGHQQGAHPPAPSCQGIHSYLADGTQACWRPRVPGRFALDVERVTTPPPHVAARTTSGSFWDAWVVAEVVAKLTGTPILVLAAAGLPVDVPTGVDVVVQHHDGVVVGFGHRSDVVT